MSENSLFPRKSDIFGSNNSRQEMRDLSTIIGRPSLDTLFQVNFSFGNFSIWLKDFAERDGYKRTQGLGFTQKLAIMCTEAEIPGTSFQTSLAVGHHQGIQEEFPNLRTFPPLNLTFYVDADHVVLEIMEAWMTYINPITGSKRNLSAYGRFNYPETYKEVLHVTKFERDAFIDKSETKLLSYEFVNVWPTNMTSMRVAYGQSNVLRCSVQFAYDRYFTKVAYEQTNNAVEASFFDQLSNQEQKALYDLKRSFNSYNNKLPIKGSEGDTSVDTTGLIEAPIQDTSIYGDHDYNDDSQGFVNGFEIPKV